MKGKNLVVFGAGNSGLAAIKLLAKKGVSTICVSRGEPKSWSNFSEIKDLIGGEKCIDQKNASDIFANAETIVLSPGIPPHHPALKPALENEVPIISEIELAYRYMEQDIPIIAITGTNGKTTTVSLLAKLLEEQRRSVFLGGNIGHAFSHFVLESQNKKFDFIVLELSSFQLEHIETFRPHIAGILNLSPHHGERYQDFKSYIAAKMNMLKNMKKEDHFVYYDVDESHMEEFLKKSEVTRHKVRMAELRGEVASAVDFKKLRLIGEHNLFNIGFCLKILKMLEIPLGNLDQALAKFEPLPHRLELLGEYHHLMLVNDSKSTNYLATITAISSLSQKGKELYLILGGQLRGENDSPRDLIDHVEKMEQKLGRIFLIGDAATYLEGELSDKIPVQNCKNLEGVMDYIQKNPLKGTLLFSPAFPSFDQFKNFNHRGNEFKRLCAELDAPLTPINHS